MGNRKLSKGKLSIKVLQDKYLRNNIVTSDVSIAHDLIQTARTKTDLKVR